MYILEHIIMKVKIGEYSMGTKVEKQKQDTNKLLILVTLNNPQPAYVIGMFDEVNPGQPKNIEKLRKCGKRLPFVL